jgi:hypothetical protein
MAFMSTQSKAEGPAAEGMVAFGRRPINEKT